MSDVPINNYSLINITGACDRWSDYENALLEEMYASYLKAQLKPNEATLPEWVEALTAPRSRAQQPKVSFDAALKELLGGG